MTDLTSRGRTLHDQHTKAELANYAGELERKLRDVFNIFEIEGIESWAEVIVKEWHEGNKDYASMKVAEKILNGLKKLETAESEERI